MAKFLLSLSFHGRPGPLHSGPILILLLLVGLLPLAGCGGDQGPELWIIGLDGGDWDMLEPWMAAGEMPNLAKLRREGTWGRLISDEPMLSPILWTSIATGKTPDLHGVTWFMSDGPEGSKIPVSSRNRWVRAVWNMASEHDQKVGIIGWWASWPAEPVKGWIVTDYVAYHSFGVSGTGLEVPGKTWPPELEKEILPLFPAPAELPQSLLLELVDTTPAQLDKVDPSAGPYGGPVQHLRQSVATTIGYTDVALEQLRSERPRLFGIYYEGTDATMHLFGEYMPPRLPWVSDEDYHRYSGTVAAYWKWQDEQLGKLLAERGENTVVMVVSDHGFRTGDERLKEEEFSIDTADQSHMPDGIVLLNGPGIQKGGKLDRARIYDVTPTALHLLGLPVGEDMTGHVLEDAFTPDYRREHPVQTIPTYETGEWDRGDEIVVDPAAGKNLEEMLRSLGYIGGGGEMSHEGSSGAAPGGTANVEQSVNLAVVLRKQHRYDEAVDLLQEVLAKAPEHQEALFNLATTYAEAGELDKAEPLFAKLVQLEPDDLRNRENLALCLGRQGKLEEALQVYDAALQHDPDWARAVAGRGFVLHRLGQSEEGLKEVERSLTMDPRQADALYYKGKILSDLGRLPEAKQALQAALRLEPNHGQARAALSGVLSKMGDAQGAARLLDSVDSSDPGVMAQKGSVALQQGRLDEAIPLLEKAAPALKDPQVYGNLGMAYAMAGELPKGARAFEKALELDPDMQDARAQLAAFYAQMGRMDDAMAAMDQALEARPDDPRFLVQKGVFLMMQGEEDEGRAMFRKARQIDPQVPLPPGIE